MTEAEWLACEDLAEMIEFLGKKASDRKLRLFRITCCRRIWDLLPTDAHREAVLVAERYADGQASDKKRLEAQKRISTRKGASRLEIGAHYAAYYTLEK